MKKRTLAIFTLLLVILVATLNHAQVGYVALKTNTFTMVSIGSTVRLIGTSAGFHKLAWNVVGGTLTACTVKLEQSADGSTGWSDLIAGQTCTSNGASAITSGSPNYVRINTTAFTVNTGAPSLVVTYTGYVNSPGSASTIDGVTFDLHTITPSLGDVPCFSAGSMFVPCALLSDISDAVWAVHKSTDTTAKVHLAVGSSAGNDRAINTADADMTLPTTTALTSLKVWTCEVVIGDPGAASAALADDNDSPDVCANDTAVTITITAVHCYANAGSPTVTPIVNGGSATSILSGALTCSQTAGGAAGSLQGTPTLTAGQLIDANITTAGGTAKYIVMRFTGTKP